MPQKYCSIMVTPATKRDFRKIVQARQYGTEANAAAIIISAELDRIIQEKAVAIRQGVERIGDMLKQKK